MSDFASITIIALALVATLVYFRLIHWKVEAQSLARQLRHVEESYRNLAKRQQGPKCQPAAPMHTRERSTAYGKLRVYDGGGE